MTKTEAKKIIDTAWTQVMDAQQTRGASYDLSEALKAEQKEARSPSFTRHGIEWCKAGLLSSVLRGAHGNPHVGSLYGLRLAHVIATMVGGAHSSCILPLKIDAEQIRTAREFF